jgi:hypothetical protein
MNSNPTNREKVTRRLSRGPSQSSGKSARTSRRVELGNEPATFERVAELIVQDAGDVEWLARGLRNWVWPQEGWPQKLRSPQSDLGMFQSMAQGRWSRAELIKALRDTVPQAAETLSDLLRDFALSNFLTDEQLGTDFGPLQRVHLLSLLHEVKRRSEAVSRFRAFISESGKTKAGRNRPLAPDQIDERVACASAIKVARQLLTEEPLTLRQASKAAHLLYELGMAPAGRFDLVARKGGWGGDPLNSWSPYFRKARSAHRMLERLNGMLADQLKVARDLHARGLKPRYSFQLRE